MACQLQLQLGCCSWVAVGAAGVWVLAVGSGLGCAEWFRVWLGRAGQDLSALAALLCLVICWDSWYRASRFRRIRNQAEWRIVCLHNCWILPWPAAQCFCFWAVLKVTCHAVGASLWGLFGAVHGVDKQQLHLRVVCCGAPLRRSLACGLLRLLSGVRARGMRRSISASRGLNHRCLHLFWCTHVDNVVQGACHVAWITGVWKRQRGDVGSSVFNAV